MTVIMQAVSSSNGQAYQWNADDWDAGAGFPGPGSALHVAKIAGISSAEGGVVLPGIRSNFVVRRNAAGTAFEATYLVRNLLDFVLALGGTPPGPTYDAGRDDSPALAAALNYCAVNKIAYLPVPTGHYTITREMVEQCQPGLVALCVHGEAANFRSAFDLVTGGTVFHWKGNDATKDIFHGGLPYQKWVNITLVAQNALRSGWCWENTSYDHLYDHLGPFAAHETDAGRDGEAVYTNYNANPALDPHNVGSMTKGVWEHCSVIDPSISGRYKWGIVVTPDAPYITQFNHDFIRIIGGHFWGFSDAGFSVRNTAGNSFDNYLEHVEFFGTVATHNCLAVDFQSGSFRALNCAAFQCTAKHNLNSNQQISWLYGDAEFCTYNYQTAFGGDGRPYVASGGRSLLANAANSGDTSLVGQSIVDAFDDNAAGPRLFQGEFWEGLTTEARNWAWSHKNAHYLENGVNAVYLCSMFPSGVPYQLHAGYDAPYARTRWQPIGSRVWLPLARGTRFDGFDAEYSTAGTRSAVLLDPQEMVSNWVLDPHDESVGAFFEAGPRMIYALTGGAIDLWVDSAGHGDAVPIAGGAAPTVLHTTQTGAPEILVGNNSGTNTAMTAPDHTKRNPGSASFWILAVITPILTATAGAYQAVISKGLSTDIVAATNFACLLDATGHPVLRWGATSGQQYTASSQVLTAKKTQVVLWGVDRDTKHVVYGHDSTGGWIIERLNLTITAEVFSNTNPIGIGMNSDGSLPMLGGGCGITTWCLRTGTINDALIKATAVQMLRRYNVRLSV